MHLAYFSFYLEENTEAIYLTATLLKMYVLVCFEEGLSIIMLFMLCFSFFPLNLLYTQFNYLLQNIATLYLSFT